MDDLSFSPRAALAMGILTGLATLPLSAGQAAWDARLEMHAPETTARFNAVCLDGSPAGYYFRPASNPAAATKWKFHFCGGGWCTSEETCYSRGFGGSPHPQMGSSQSWPPWLSTLLLPPGAAFYGLMSQNESSVNPFGDWNFVWLAYCDGSSQLSDRDAPFEFNGSLVHLRGRAILDAHLYELERVHGFLSTATEVVVSGTSAGGLSTFMHASFIKTQLLVPEARLVAVPDAGYWWDTLSYSGTARPWLDLINASIPASLWNATLRGGAGRCLAAPPDGVLAKCYSQPYAYAFLDVPTFVVQSLVDPSGLNTCFQMPCHLSGDSGNGTCTAAEVAGIQGYALALQESILAAQEPFGDRDGHFMTTCNQHEESCRWPDWFGVTIDDQTMNSTLWSWYTLGGGDPRSSRIDAPFPADQTCNETFSHGWC